MGSEFVAGRVETLTTEEELRLKEFWTHFLTFWGRPVKVSTSKDGKKLLRASSSLSNDYDPVEEDKKPLKIGKLFGRKKKDQLPAVTPEPTNGHKRVNSLSESIKRIPLNIEIENKYTNEMVHTALKDLKPDEIFDIFWNFLRLDSPDNLVLRFLRARKWDVDKSLAMILNTFYWRVKESNIDEILRTGELKLYQEYQKDKLHEGVFKNFEMSKSYIRGHDKLGRPIVVCRPRLHHSSDQTVEEMKLYTLLIIEDCRLFLRDKVDSASVLFDMSDFSLSNMDYTPVKFMIAAFEAHYPESLGVLIIHKAPWVFSGIWNIIKNWLDPVVASKVHFTKSTADLEQFVDNKYIPVSLGGQDKFEPVYEPPKEDENALVIGDSQEKEQLLNERKAIIEEVLAVTTKWIEADDADASAKYLAEKIAVGNKLVDNYVKLDKYIRARTVFDRWGLLESLN